MRIYEKKIFLMALIFAGCHSIHPLPMPSASLIETVPKMNNTAAVVIDRDYSHYTSKDRGNPLADPQTYYIGEALVPLTMAYLKAAFKEIQAYDNLPAGKNIQQDILIYPHVENFENFLRLGKQTISLKLQTDVYDSRLQLLAKVRSSGVTRKTLGFFDPSQEVSENVSEAIQQALVDMLKTIQEKTELKS